MRIVVSRTRKRRFSGRTKGPPFVWLKRMEVMDQGLPDAYGALIWSQRIAPKKPEDQKTHLNSLTTKRAFPVVPARRCE